MAKTKMEIDSVRVSMMNYQHVVILKEPKTNRYLPIWIGPAEADAISIKLQNIDIARPMTHDLICAIISTSGGTLKEAVINKIENDCYYSKLVVIINKKEREIDCRPSDALATAIRLGAPIFADEKVLKKAGVILDPKPGKPIPLQKESGTVEQQRNIDEQELQKLKDFYDFTKTLDMEDKRPIERESSHFDLFSDSAQNVFNSAEKEAKRLNQNFIGTGHLLLALMKEHNIATEVLRNLGVNLDNIQAEIEASIGGQSDLEREEAGLTTSVKRTITLSVEEAKRLGSDKIKPEHILIGLSRQDDGLAANLLKKLGIATEKIYVELIRLYSGTRNFG
jgi:bifunctional DNase/RNase